MKSNINFFVMERIKNKIVFPFPSQPRALMEFERVINIHFNKKELLRRAFAHRSYLNENKGSIEGSNERLEFLGDAVVQLIVTNYLYKTYTEIQEGELSKFRSALVNTETFAEIAQSLKMYNYILLSEGQKRDNDRSLTNIMADAFEALIGAIYLDQGYEIAEGFITKYLLCRAQEYIDRFTRSDWKSLLQERAQALFNFTPLYEIVSDTGPDNDKIFIVEVYCGDANPSRGSGKSKKEAEQQAARTAMESRSWN
jgi:ribonuclease-3